MVLNPTCLDPLTVGCRYLDRKLVPVLSHVAPAPVSVLQLVRCNCEKSKCSREGAHAEGTMWYVPNYANVAEKATTVRTLHHQ